MSNGPGWRHRHPCSGKRHGHGFRRRCRASQHDRHASWRASSSSKRVADEAAGGPPISADLSRAERAAFFMTRRTAPVARPRPLPPNQTMAYYDCGPLRRDWWSHAVRGLDYRDSSRARSRALPIRLVMSTIWHQPLLLEAARRPSFCRGSPCFLTLWVADSLATCRQDWTIVRGLSHDGSWQTRRHCAPIAGTLERVRPLLTRCPLSPPPPSDRDKRGPLVSRRALNLLGAGRRLIGRNEQAATVPVSA